MLPISTPALLFPAIAILMLGYINRYLGTAAVIRNYKKDYDSGYKHAELSKQLKILKNRIELSRYMLAVSVIALMAACLSMLFIFLKNQLAGELMFALSVVGMVIGLGLSLYELHLSNKSLIIEITDILKKEKDL